MRFVILANRYVLHEMGREVVSYPFATSIAGCVVVNYQKPLLTFNFKKMRSILIENWNVFTKEEFLGIFG